MKRPSLERHRADAGPPRGGPASALDPSGSDEHSYARLFSPSVRKLTSSNISFPSRREGTTSWKLTPRPRESEHEIRCCAVSPFVCPNSCRVKILFITEQFPLPLDTGANVRTFNMLK